MFCTVIVCTRDRPQRLERCLAALAQLDHCSHDILVVDNAPTTGATRDVATAANVRYVVEPEIGLSRARNRGVRESSSELVAFIDDDCVADSGWLSALVGPFMDSRVMATGGQVRSLGSTTVVPGDDPITVDSGTANWFELTNFGRIGSGANMAFRRSMFGAWPGFDERLGLGASIPGGEEHAAFFSIVQRGFKVAHVPTAVVHHEEPSTPSQRRARSLTLARAMAGYVLFLLATERAHRRDTLRFVLHVLRRNRMWSPTETRDPGSPLPTLDRLLAYVQGSITALRALTPWVER